MKLVSGTSNQTFAQELAKQLDIDYVAVDISRFKNGEKRVWINDSVQGENIVLVQSFSNPTDEHIIEFLLLADALERLGARHVNAIIPWMGYSLQDKVFRTGEPIAAKVVANLVSNSYIKRAFLLDLHNTSIPGFFSIPTHHISAIDLFAEYATSELDTNNLVVASPDFGGLKRARVFADILGTNLVNIDKHRDLNTGDVTAVGMSGGEVTGKSVILFDDCILSGGTVVETAKLLKEQGAKDVHFFATHGLYVGDAQQKLEASDVDTVVTTDTIFHQEYQPKMRVVPSASLFADAIQDWM